ncbi:MAG: band 7 protein [Chloroflexi bacterium]|nr:MAG: band 7 protein [Chloroflexota bacterium]
MTQELEYSTRNGWLVLAVNIVLYIVSVLVFIPGVNAPSVALIVAAAVVFLVGVLMSIGFFIVNPNEGRALVLFGTYKGTAKRNGFHWANPFLSKKAVSLRARNFNSERLKVNDSSGNPIEIAAVVVWRVQDTARALFDVDDFEQYVKFQSEAAIRHLAGSYPYDAPDDEPGHIALSRNSETVTNLLEQELSARLERAGIEIIEARLSYLAYAPEIAEAMLRRQQATAVVAARRQIVDGAVGMVELALERLANHNVVALDEERKASMVTNLLVVLCSENPTSPVVNAGTLYH